MIDNQKLNKFQSMSDSELIRQAAKGGLPHITKPDNLKELDLEREEVIEVLMQWDEMHNP